MESGTIIPYFDAAGKAKRHYAGCLNPICKQYGLSRNELDVLLFLHNNPGCRRAADIVHGRGISKSHVSLSVANLEDRGLLTRRFDPEDRRAVQLELTEAGRQIAEAGRQAQKRYFAELFANLTAEELAAWRRITEKVWDNINHMDTEEC